MSQELNYELCPSCKSPIYPASAVLKACDTKTVAFNELLTEKNLPQGGKLCLELCMGAAWLSHEAVRSSR